MCLLANNNEPFCKLLYISSFGIFVPIFYIWLVSLSGYTIQNIFGQKMTTKSEWLMKMWRYFLKSMLRKNEGERQVTKIVQCHCPYIKHSARRVVVWIPNIGLIVLLWSKITITHLENNLLMPTYHNRLNKHSFVLCVG